MKHPCYDCPDKKAAPCHPEIQAKCDYVKNYVISLGRPNFPLPIMATNLHPNGKEGGKKQMPDNVAIEDDDRYGINTGTVTEKMCINETCPYGMRMQPIRNFRADRRAVDGYKKICIACENDGVDMSVLKRQRAGSTRMEAQIQDDDDFDIPRNLRDQIIKLAKASMRSPVNQLIWMIKSQWASLKMRGMEK
jgi:hypothetical protein